MGEGIVLVLRVRVRELGGEGMDVEGGMNGRVGSTYGIGLFAALLMAGNVTRLALAFQHLALNFFSNF